MAAPRQRRVRRYLLIPLRVLRALGYLLVAILALAVILLGYLSTSTGQDQLRRIVLSQTREMIPGLQVRRLGGDLLSGLVFHDVVLTDRFGGEAIRLDRLALRYDLKGLLSKQVRVLAVELDGPQVVARPTKNGRLNLAELVVLKPEEEQPSPEPSAWTVAVSSVKLRRGSFDLEASAGQRYSVRHLSLDAGLELAGETVALDLGQASGRVSLPGQPAIEALIRGRLKVDKERIQARTEIRARASRPSRQVTLSLSARGSLSRLDLTLAARTPGNGTLSLDGRLGLHGSQLGDYQARIRLSRIDPRALLPELFPADVNLELDASGRGIPLQSGSQARFSLQVKPSVALGYRLSGLTARGSLADETWKLKELELAASGARLKMSGTGTLTSADSRIRLSVGDLKTLPLPGTVPRLAGSVELDTRVTAGLVPRPRGATRSMVARLLGEIPVKLAASGTVKVKDLSAGGLRVGSGEIDLRLTDILTDPGGRLQVRASGIRSRTGAILLSEAAVALAGDQRRLSVGVQASRPEMSARFDLVGTLSPERIALQLQRLDVRYQRVALQLLEELQVVVRPEESIQVPPLRIRTLGGEVRAEATYRFRGQPRLQARLEAVRIRPLKGPPLSARLTAVLGRRALQAALEADIGSGLSLRARVPVRYRRGSPALDRREPLDLLLRAPDLPLSLLHQLVPAAPALGGTASIRLRGTGSFHAPEVSLDLTLDRVSSPWLQEISAAMAASLGRRDATLKLAVSHRGRTMLDLHAKAPIDLAALIEAGPRLLEELGQMQASAKLELHRTALSDVASLVPVLSGARGTAAAHLDIRGTLNQPSVKIRAALQGGLVAGQHLGDISADVDLSGQLDRITGTVSLKRGQDELLQVTSLRAPPVVQLLQARDPLALPFEATVVIFPLRLGSLRRHHAIFARADGILAGRVELRGSGRFPRATAEISLRGARFDKLELGSLDARGKMQNRRLGLELELRQERGGRLLAAGSLDLANKDGLSARLELDRLELGFARGLSPELKDLAGQLSGSVQVDGGLSAPRMRGQVRLDGGRVALFGLPPLSEISMVIDLRPHRIRLTSLSARSGPGSLEASGHVDLKGLAPGPFQLSLKADRIDVGLGPLTDSRLYAELEVDGRLVGSQLFALVHLRRGSLKLAGLGGGPSLHSTDPLVGVVFEEQARASKKPRASPLGLDIRVRVDPYAVRGDDLDVQAETDLRARTDPGGKIRLHGWAGLRPGGTLKLLGNLYTIRRARALFRGRSEPDPVLDIVVTRRIQNVLLLVKVKGTARAHRLELSSDPSGYTRDQIIAMIATGRVEAESEESGDSGGTQQATSQSAAVASALSGAIVGAVAGKAASRVGLDVARVNVQEQQTEDEGRTLQAQAEVGKYLTKKLYVGYRRVFGATASENENEGLLEYLLSRRWMLTARYGDAGVGGVEVFWTFRY